MPDATRASWQGSRSPGPRPGAPHCPAFLGLSAHLKARGRIFQQMHMERKLQNRFSNVHGVKMKAGDWTQMGRRL